MTHYQRQAEEIAREYREAGCGALAPAIRAALEGGNRVRPALALAWCEACGGTAGKAAPLALAAELIHTMSLVHDDLPCMDNAKTRRGRAACHVQFGEGSAVLAGDRLLAAAFGVIAGSGLPAGQVREAVAVLSRAAERMADGQAEELAGSNDWEHICLGKTAALLECACELGVIAAGGTAEQRAQAVDYGRSLGLGYQLLDDAQDGDGAALTLGAAGCLGAARSCLARCTVPGNGPAAEALRRLPEVLAR